MVHHKQGKISSFVWVFFCVCVWDVFLVTYEGELIYLRPLHTQMAQVAKTLIQWDAICNFCSPQCAVAIIQPPMTQGQGEGKVKLHTMNLVAAGSPLSDMGFV